MTKKDYQLIAEAIKRTAWDVDEIDRPAKDKKLKAVSGELASKLEKDNPRFDRVRFFEACTVFENDEPVI